MKKLLLTFSFLLISIVVNAGDLHVNCFKDRDDGVVLQLSETFMESNRISLQFDYLNHTYVVFVERESLFNNYVYRVFKINKKNMSYQTMKFKVAKSITPIDIDEHVSCYTND